MSAADYLAGAGIFAAMFIATLAGAWLLLQRRYRHLRGAEAVVAFAALAALGILAVHLLPAAAGILGRGSVLAAAILWLLACRLVPAGPPVAAEDPPEVDDRYAPASRPLAALACGLAAVFVVTFALDQVVRPAVSVDLLNFHLPSAIGWIQSGSLWQVDNFLPMVAPGNYPNNGDVMLLAAILPWHNDFLAHLAIWPFFVLTGVATYAGSMRLGAARSAALVAGCLALAIPVVAVAAMAASITDSVMYFGLTTGLLFLLRHHRTSATSDLVLAGLALGLALGTKWYGVSAVAIVVVVWLGAGFVSDRPARAVVRGGAQLVGLVALAGGIWMLRNWIISGNPVFPVRVAPLGITLFDAPADVVREQAGFTILDYLGDWDVWWKLEGNPELGGAEVDGILLQWWHALAAPALLAVGGAVTAAVLVVRRTTRAVRGPVIAGLLMAGLIVLAYSATPYTAGGPEGLPILVGADSRYVVPALLIAIGLTAWGLSRVVAGTVALGIAGVAAMAHGMQWAGNGELSPAELTAGNWIAGVIVVGGVGLAWWAVEPWVERLRPVPRLARVAAVIAAGGVIVIAGYAAQRGFNDDRYLGADPVVDRVLANEAEERVGLAGVWTDAGIAPVLPAFGERFENSVDYLGPVERELQQRYGARDEFLRALEEQRLDYLLVGRGRPELPAVEEGEWARSAGWRLIESSDRLELYAPPA